MPHSTFVKTFVIQLRNEGLGYKKIRSQLAARGIFISRSAVRRTCLSFAATGSFAGKKIIRKHKFGDDQLHKNYVDQVMTENGKNS